MRVEFGGVEQSAFNNKWGVQFRMMVKAKGNDVEYAAAVTTSAAVFDTPEEAKAGADRAIVVYNQTGVFPNFCKKF